MSHDLRVTSQPDVRPDAIHHLSRSAACALAGVELGDAHVELLAEGNHLAGAILQEPEGIPDDLHDASVVPGVDLRLREGSQVRRELESAVVVLGHASTWASSLIL